MIIITKNIKGELNDKQSNNNRNNILCSNRPVNCYGGYCMDSNRNGDDLMNKFSFGGIRNTNNWYRDYDINTDNPNVYYSLTYDRDLRGWYAIRREAENDEDPFEDNEILLTKEELAAMLETMPVEALPVEVFYNDR